MKNKSEEQYMRLRKMALQEWDPIGVYGFKDSSNIEDEYDAYLPKLFELITSNASENDIYDFLYYVETTCIGVRGHSEKTKKFAKQCKSIFKSVTN